MYERLKKVVQKFRYFIAIYLKLNAGTSAPVKKIIAFKIFLYFVDVSYAVGLQKFS